VSSLTWDVIVQLIMRYIFFLAGMGGIWLAQVEINFVSSQEWEGCV
jgi:hypothetical protein